MKLITAIIKPHKLDEVKEALEARDQGCGPLSADGLDQQVSHRRRRASAPKRKSISTPR